MERIDFYDHVEGKDRAAFVVLFANDGQPWSDYSLEQGDKLKDLVVPTCLMANRSDGKVGFIGGLVDGDESLEDGVIREVGEEIGYKINEDLDPLVAFDIGRLSTHAFTAKLPHEKLLEIQAKASRGVHFGSEITGLFLPHLVDYDETFGRGGGLPVLLGTSMASSVKEELAHLLIDRSIMSLDEFDRLARKIGSRSSVLLGE